MEENIRQLISSFELSRTTSLVGSAASCSPKVPVAFELLRNEPVKGPPRSLLERLEQKSFANDSCAKRQKHKKRKPLAEKHPNKAVFKPRSDGHENVSETASLKGPSPAIIGVGAGIEDQPQVEVGPPEPLNDDERELLQDVISILGENTVRLLISHRWQHRMDAVNQLKQLAVETMESRMIRCMPKILTKLLLDSVLQVYMPTVELLRSVCELSASRLDGEDVRSQLGVLLPILIQRSGDMNSKISKAATDLLLHLADLECFGHSYIASLVVEPLASGGSVPLKQQMARLGILLALVNKSGFRTSTSDSNHGLDIAGYMKAAVEALNTSNPKIRKQAALMVVEAYRLLGKGMVEPHLRACRPATLKYLKTEVEVELCDMDVLQNTDLLTQEEEDLQLIEEFSEEEASSMQPFVNTFGTGIRCLFSKKWKLRENALGRLEKTFDDGSFLNNRPVSETKRSLLLCCRLMGMGVQDIVPSVFVASCSMIRAAIAGYAKVVGAGDLQIGLAIVLSQLVSKCGHLNPMIKIATNETLNALAKEPKIGVGIVGTKLMASDDSLSQWRTFVGRIVLVSELLEKFGFTTGGLTVELVMNFALKAFECTNGKVRKAAIDLIVCVYKAAGNVIRPYFTTLKPALLEELQARLAKIARKDRSKTGAAHCLASIVAPLGSVSATSCCDVQLGKQKAERPPSFLSSNLDTSVPLTLKERILEHHKALQQRGSSPTTENEEDGSGGSASSSCASTDSPPPKVEVMDGCVVVGKERLAQRRKEQQQQKAPTAATTSTSSSSSSHPPPLHPKSKPPNMVIPNSNVCSSSSSSPATQQPMASTKATNGVGRPLPISSQAEHPQTQHTTDSEEEDDDEDGGPPADPYFATYTGPMGQASQTQRCSRARRAVDAAMEGRAQSAGPLIMQGPPKRSALKCRLMFQ